MDINLPETFTKRMQDMLKEEFNEFAESYALESIHGLRVNPLKYKSGSLSMFSLEQIPWCENGFYYLNEDRPGKHPYHDAGVYYIQEPSAMLVGELTDAEPGERVLDLCAAPGGKTTHIAGQMQGKGLLWSNEIHPQRAKILSQNVERLGITNCVVSNESADRLADRMPGFFDRIVIDAPCSGEGMFRKNPDACGEWSLENVKNCAARQQDILNEADRMLKSGGRLVYSTCTFSPEENEQTVEKFLENHPDYSIEKITVEPVSKESEDKFGMPSKGRPEWSENNLKELKNTFRLWPHRLKGEGHFAAVLRKNGSLHKSDDIGYLGGDSAVINTVYYNNINIADSDIVSSELYERKYSNVKRRDNIRKSQKRNSVNLKTAGNIRQAAALFEEFAGEYLKLTEISVQQGTEYPLVVREKTANVYFDIKCVDRYLLFGENLYIVPSEMPDISGLKIVRPGFHVGTVKKERFEPSHALALALKASEVINFIDIPADDERIYAFLRGESFEADASKGWVLVCAGGYSLGWGKASSGIVKNHYPKGLRRA